VTVARPDPGVIDRSLLAADAPAVAPQLLGGFLVSGNGSERIVGRITDVEAYTADDPASHTFRGPTRRNATMFASAGHLYVYLIYGLHHCANVVTGALGDGQAVLIRGVEIVEGHEIVARRRCGVGPRHWSDGPGKMCAALGIDRRHDGIDLCDQASAVWIAPALEAPALVHTGTRIGLSVASDRPWRWWLDRS